MRLIGSCVAGAVFVVSAVAVGAPVGYEAQYKAALKLEIAGDVVGALVAFEAIPEAKRDFDTRLHIASCHRKLGHFLLAAEMYEAIRLDPKADAATVETAASDLEAVVSATPRLVLSSTPAAKGVAVTIDDVSVALPSEHRVDPGTHVVRGRRGERVVFSQTLQVNEGTRIDVVVDAPADVVPAPAPIAAPTRALVEKPPADTRWAAAIPFLGAGVALAGVAIGARFAVRSATDDVRVACATQSTSTCDLDAAGAGTVRRWEAVSFVTGGAAILSAGVGAALLLKAGSERATARLAPSIGVMNGLVWEGTF